LEELAPVDSNVSASVNELRQRDPHSLTDAELETVLAADRSEDARHRPIGKSIYRSEYLSPEDEARYAIFENGKPNIHLVSKRGQLVMVVPEPARHGSI
jgi:hypothetical protein